MALSAPCRRQSQSRKLGTALRFLERHLVALIVLALPVPLPAVAAEPATAVARAPDLPSRLELLNRPERIDELLATSRIARTDVPNPHWTDDGCPGCHRKAPTAKDHALRAGGNIIRLCLDCHERISAHNYIHAVGMKPSSEKRNRMNEDMRQALKRGGGVITCISCHDLTRQCHPERTADRRANPLFFRGGPYESRSSLCYTCHNPSHYERLNPHDQITDEGELNVQICLVCHAITPNRNEVKSIADVSFSMNEDLTKLCAGCHPPRPHPAAPVMYSTAGNPHLREPREDILQFIRETEDRRSIVLPLDPTNGKMFCATCHNPHERGVQVSDRADRGADGFRRLRGAQSDEGICMICHNM